VAPRTSSVLGPSRLLLLVIAAAVLSIAALVGVAWAA
jgi:hypothetical protein